MKPKKKMTRKKKTDIIDGETRRRDIFSASVGRARVFDWSSGQCGESDKR